MGLYDVAVFNYVCVVRLHGLVAQLISYLRGMSGRVRRVGLVRGTKGGFAGSWRRVGGCTSSRAGVVCLLK